MMVWRINYGMALPSVLSNWQTLDVLVSSKRRRAVMKQYLQFC